MVAEFNISTSGVVVMCVWLSKRIFHMGRVAFGSGEVDVLQAQSTATSARPMASSQVSWDTRDYDTHHVLTTLKAGSVRARAPTTLQLPAASSLLGCVCV